MQTVTAVLGQLQRLVEELTSTRGRLAASAAVLVVALLVVGVIAPYLVRRLDRFVDERLGSGRFRGTVQLLGEHAPTKMSGVFLRGVQLTVFLGAILALLVVWGLIDVATTLLVWIGLSVPALARLGTTLMLAALAYVGFDLYRNAVRQFSREADRVTEHQEEIVIRVGQIAIVALVISGALTVWGIDLSGLLVGAGFLGIVVGLAARQTLGSMIAGFVLMFSRPFTIGDWVKIGDQEGIVTDITIMNTRLENFDGEFVVIPNDRVSDSAVVNRSSKGLLRLRVDVGIDYETDPARAEEVALTAMKSVQSVVDAPPPHVVPKNFGDSAIVLELRFWIDEPTPPRKWAAVSGVVQSVKAAFEREDIKIPFPQRELSGRAETGGFRVHGDGLVAESVDGEATDGPESP